MIPEITVGLDAKDAERYFKKNIVAAKEATRLSIITASKFGRSESSKEIFGQVNLKKSYIDERLKLTFGGKDGLPIGKITGRWRPTSLSRFLVAEPKKGKLASVRVSRGGPITKGRFFSAKLRSGTDGLGNRGLALRVKPGESLVGSDAAILLRSDKRGDTYLLYGPSINQVFRTVRYDVIESIENKLTGEFKRQFERLSN